MEYDKKIPNGRQKKIKMEDDQTNPKWNMTKKIKIEDDWIQNGRQKNKK